MTVLGVRMGEKVTTPMNERIAALEARMTEVEARAASLRYCGVWEEGSAYAQGNFVTHSGSVWHANTTTTSRPGTDATWTLAVKHGRDLR
ncbi:MAG: carbohydrate-binding family V/XII protein [Betaproteobacteria bacterium]|nr:carbohydrate-binding family V/XII protein [Betaproteobacteria bacterium]